MEQKFFMHRIKQEAGNWDKGIEIHDSMDSALGSYHAYLGAYAYNNKKAPDVTFVSCMITNSYGDVEDHKNETWIKPEPEPEPVEETPAEEQTAEEPVEEEAAGE